MTAIVHDRRILVRTDDVRAGQAVRAATWRDMALSTNHTLGRGMQLIPACAPVVTLVKTTAYELYFRVRPRYQALQRGWLVGARAAAAGAYMDIEVPSGGTSVEAPAYWSRNYSVTTGTYLLETLAAQSETEGELRIKITPQGDNVVLEHVSCWEMPRAALAVGGSELGTDVIFFAPAQPIRGGDVTGMVGALTDPTTIGRRVLYQWAVPVTVNGSASTAFAIASTAGGYASLFDLPIPVLARKLTPAATTGTITSKVLAWVDSGTAQVRLDSTIHGSSSAINVSSTTPVWSSAMTLSVDAEDLTASDGLQSATFDELNVQAQKGTATTIYVAGVSIWEA